LTVVRAYPGPRKRPAGFRGKSRLGPVGVLVSHTLAVCPRHPAARRRSVVGGLRPPASQAPPPPRYLVAPLRGRRRPAARRPRAGRRRASPPLVVRAVLLARLYGRHPCRGGLCRGLPAAFFFFLRQSRHVGGLGGPEYRPPLARTGAADAAPTETRGLRPREQVKGPLSSRRLTNWQTVRKLVVRTHRAILALYP
jgi:hypothetical protein